MDRVSELEDLYGVVRAALAEAGPESRASLVAQGRFILAELHELRSSSSAGSVVSEGAVVTPLDEVRRRREGRKSS